MKWVSALLLTCKEKPWNLFFLISSYKLMLRSSKVMQMWFRKVKLSIMWIIFMVLSCNISWLIQFVTSSYTSTMKAINNYIYMENFRETSLIRKLERGSRKKMSVKRITRWNECEESNEMKVKELEASCMKSHNATS